MKKIYNQPSVEVMDIQSGELMQGVLTVSVNHGSSGSSGGGTAGARRRGDIIP